MYFVGHREIIGQDIEANRIPADRAFEICHEIENYLHYFLNDN